MKKKMGDIGFTLIELLCVLVILALLALIVGRSVAKSVSQAKDDISDSQERAVLSAAEKWAIDNADQFDDVDGSVMQIGLDVVFILDISGSMGFNNNFVTGSDGKKISRYQAMVEATDEAFKVLATSNPANRVGMVAFGTSVATWLPLDSYYSTGSNYITWTKVNGTGDDWGTVSFPNLYNSKNSRITQKYTLANVGTDTQEGIYAGAKLLLNTSVADAQTRIPVVVLLTDGVPNQYQSASLCSTSICTSASLKKTGWSSDNLKYYYALMAGYESRLQVQQHYSGNEVFFYTIGFAVNSTDAQKILNPGAFTQTQDYNYVTKAYLDEQMSTDDLKSIFVSISNEVVEATKVTNVCVSIEELKDGGYLSKDAKINDELAKSTYVIMSENEATNQYTFSIAKTEDQKQACLDFEKQKNSNS